ncbi:copper resistance protein CopC [Paenibacillus sp. M1]|uniref:Copper resistance protein CopC n=1 Tax=Paenibacillus haidiansis TaxID=1574488 RepID=A0ABU7VRI5_9BACL
MLRKNRKIYLIFVFVVFCALLLFPPTKQASAHAYIVASSPAADEVLDKAPSSLFIQFNEAVEPAFFSLSVLGPAGERADLGDAAIDPGHPDKLVAGLKPDLPEGAYTVKWKVVSSDGHPVTGTLLFQIGASGGSPDVQPGSSVEPAAAPGADLLLVRWLWYAGMTLFSGVLILHLILLPRSSRSGDSGLPSRSKWAILLGLALTVAAVLGSLPQQTADNAGTTWAQAWNGELLRETLQHTGFGTVWKAQVLLLLLLAAATAVILKRPGANQAEPGFGKIHRYAAAAALAVGQGLFLSKAFIGHAAAAEVKSLAIAADYVHLSASALWLGGLLAVIFLLPAAAGTDPETGGRPKAYWEAIRRFSLLAAGSVTLLLISGIYGALVHIPSFDALFHTGYGIVLLCKIALFLCMLGLGVSGFIHGRRRSRPLGRGAWTEFILGLVVLALAALLANLPTAPSSGPEPGRMEAEVQGYRITLDVSPNTVGKNLFSLGVVNQDGTPAANIEQVTLSLTSNEMDMGVIEVILPGGGGKPEAEGLITMGGEWNVHVHILLESLDSLDHDFTLEVGNSS